MDTGIISVRYARALYKRCTETHNEQAAYTQMQQLLSAWQHTPELRAAIANPMIAKKAKSQLLNTACDEKQQPIEEVQRFINLVVSKGREEAMPYIAHAYIAQYRKDKQLIDARLITAVETDNDTQQKMRALVEKRTNAQVHFTTEVDTEIIGGFILEYDTYRMDASVKTQLNNILKQLQQQ